MYAGSSIVFTAHSNNSLAIVDTFNIDTVRMLDTISYPHRGHHMRSMCLHGLQSTCHFSLQVRLLKGQFWVFNCPKKSLSNLPFKATLVVLWLWRLVLCTIWSCFFIFFFIFIFFLDQNMSFFVLLFFTHSSFVWLSVHLAVIIIN